MRDPGNVLVPLAIASAVLCGVSFGGNVLSSLALPSVERSLRVTIQSEALIKPLAQLVLLPFTLIPQCIVGAFLRAGVMHFSLSVARGQRPDLAEVFVGGSLFLPMLGAEILLTLAVVAGLLFCIVPGLIVALGFMLYAPFLVDQRLGPVDALAKSWALFRAAPGNFVLLAIYSFGITVLGLFACCIGAIVVSLPLVWLAMAYAYLRATGQEVASI